MDPADGRRKRPGPGAGFAVGCETNRGRRNRGPDFGASRLLQRVALRACGSCAALGVSD